ncbi:hypothetical protein PVK06_035290 [Gossypium arboreum]|uniref:SWIM-type domain-containing protein n=1 Tax=Gossypium arboreum TaxID=29729 RepID=A0ABR0NIJ7_GOSAR|nr:hypothetical protein PVK06_035290 [Gossypium arboreum]
MLENLQAINDCDAKYHADMTANLTDCINSVLKGTRHFPITSVVKETYFHLVVLFPNRAKKYIRQVKGGHVWCEDIMKRGYNTIELYAFNVSLTLKPIILGYEFDKPNQGIVKGAYYVNLRQRTYGCGRFDTLCFPCTHAIVAYSSVRLDHMSFVDEVYKLEHLYNVWNYEFPPILNESMWPLVSSTPFKLLPNTSLRRKPKGRPNSTMISDSMNIWERTNQPRLCDYCRNLGHTRPTCPHLENTMRISPR